MNSESISLFGRTRTIASRPLGGGLEEIPTADCVAIVLSGVLHHLSDQQIKEYLGKFRRILLAGGSLIIFEPCLAAGSGISSTARAAAEGM
jgi:ribosomal protein RSM22 (predicted rRNA methylase)